MVASDRTHCPRQVHGKARMHVISGTPLEELVDIVWRRDLGRYFTSLHGAPETKAEAFTRILFEYAYEPREVLAIGDATTEYEAAAALGIRDSISWDRTSRRTQSPLSPQRANGGEVAALVGEKAQHRNRVDALHNLFVSKRHGGIGHRSPNVVGF